jgi:hypothetical protein
MITPSYGLTATERVLPRLALDFTTASLDSRVTFTRTGNTATVTNSSGYVVPINADLPRFDFDPITLLCKGLLVEELRLNMLTYSSQFNNVAWTKDNFRGTFATNAISPDGTTTAQTLTAGSANFGYAYRSVTTIISTYYSFSIYAKAGTSNFAYIQIMGSGLSYINLTTLQISAAAGTTVTATSVGNGWVRIVGIRPAAGLSSLIVFGGSNASGSQAFTSGNTILVWGAQLEEGAFATSFIPTELLTVTRNADVATMTGTNFSSWYNATEGGAVVQVLPSTISGTRPAVEFDDNTANESITLRGVAADPQLFVVDGGATQATLDAGTITANTLYKLGGAWKESSFAVALNGAAAVTQASGTFPTATQARLGSDGTNYLNGHLQSLRFCPQRLTNAEVQAFSK